MSSQRQFEGADVRQLLAEIREAYGYEPTIARAEKYRTGGILGFFQREQYRLLVDEAPPDPSGPAGLDPFTVLADDTVDRNLVGAGPPAFTSANGAGPTRPAGNSRQAPLTRTAERRSRDANFESVLQRVASAVAAPAASTIATPARPPANPAGAPITTPAGPPVGAPLAAVAGPAPGRAAVPAALPVAGAQQGVPGSVAIPPGDDAAPADATLLARALAGTGLTPAIAAQAAQAVSGGRPLEAALTDALTIGIARPAKLSRRRGTLIAVVGSSDATSAVATLMASRVGTEGDRILFAAPRFAPRSVPAARRLRSAEDASAIAPGYRRGAVAVVAVAAPVGAADGPWADRMLAALRPSLVVGVVEATQKPEDVLAWTESLGGVDALAIDSPSSTVSPAALLPLPIPVILLGTDDATPARWAALIAERVAKCV